MLRLAFKWLARGFLILVTLTLGGLALGYYLVTRSIPDYDAAFEVAGPGAEVRIVRDAHAVPHIFGETDADVYFGFGFAQAQDRLWQMEMSRRAAQGRLSELFGEATLSVDRMMRALDLHALAREAAAVQSPEAQAALAAYAAGVNAFIATVRKHALGRGAPEFFLFGAEIAPWTPADSISIQKLMALRLSDHAARETRRAALSTRLPAERAGRHSARFSRWRADRAGALRGAVSGRTVRRRRARPAGGGAGDAGAGVRRRLQRLGGGCGAGGGRKAAFGERPASLALGPLALASGAARISGRRGDRGRGSGPAGHRRRAQPGARLGRDLFLCRRSGRLCRTGEPRERGRVSHARRLGAV